MADGGTAHTEKQQNTVLLLLSPPLHEHLYRTYVIVIIIECPLGALRFHHHHHHRRHHHHYHHVNPMSMYIS